MRTTSAGLAALVAAAGIWMGVSGEPAMAAKSAQKMAQPSASAANRPVVLSKFKKQRAQTAKKSRTAQARHAKKSTFKVSSKTRVLATSPADKPAITANKIAADAGKDKYELPASVANARAQALAADNARNISALDSADVAIVDGVQLAAAGPANNAAPVPEADTTVVQDTAVTPAMTPSSTPAPGNRIARPVSAGERPVFKADDSDPWSKSSLIGKIFIAFGSLLTLASAARLIIA